MIDEPIPGGCGRKYGIKLMGSILDDYFRHYFVFGKHTDGFVDVSDGEKDVVTHIRQSEAMQLIHERNVVLEALSKIFHEELTHEQQARLLQLLHEPHQVREGA